MLVLMMDSVESVPRTNVQDVASEQSASQEQPQPIVEAVDRPVHPVPLMKRVLTETVRR